MYAESIENWCILCEVRLLLKYTAIVVFLVLSKQDCITDDWKIVPTVQIEPGNLKQHLEHMSYYVGVLTVMVIVK